jgi:alkylation response protein AidB-like acyl-CoA dehydrogenase
MKFQYDFTTVEHQLSGQGAKYLDTLSSTELGAFLRENRLASLVFDYDAASGPEQLAKFANCLRQVASCWPSAGLALCMHSHIVYGLQRYPNMIACSQSALQQVQKSQALMASAFADGIIGSQVFDTALTGSDLLAETIVLKGAKLPCTLSDIADYYCFSLKSETDESFSIALTERSDNIVVDKSFWKIDLFKAASSNKVIFDQVTLGQQQVAHPKCKEMPLAMNLAMACFNYLAIACYIGVMDTLIEKITARVTPQGALLASINRIQVFDSVSFSALAEVVNSADEYEANLYHILQQRYQFEALIEEFTQQAQANLSGLTFITDADTLHLLNTLQLLKYHPISQSKFLTILASQ